MRQGWRGVIHASRLTTKIEKRPSSPGVVYTTRLTATINATKIEIPKIPFRPWKWLRQRTRSSTRLQTKLPTAWSLSFLPVLPAKSIRATGARPYRPPSPTCQSRYIIRTALSETACGMRTSILLLTKSKWSGSSTSWTRPTSSSFISTQLPKRPSVCSSLRSVHVFPTRLSWSVSRGTRKGGISRLCARNLEFKWWTVLMGWKRRLWRNYLSVHDTFLAPASEERDRALEDSEY